ncbi:MULTISPECIES: endonuclease domain-containing protein [unclassified Agrococcus]|uniref:endonuclease domain-containing protein n=1 Tax=unclassified Agrococcus TaxID=2615065 RepID=UPI00361F60FC
MSAARAHAPGAQRGRRRRRGLPLPPALSQRRGRRRRRGLAAAPRPRDGVRPAVVGRRRARAHRRAPRAHGPRGVRPREPRAASAARPRDPRPRQVRIGRMRVDLLVGERLVVECDGAEHHGGWEASAADRARDLELMVLGYRVVRPTYRQVVDDWPTVEQRLLALVRADAHRAPRTR